MNRIFENWKIDYNWKIKHIYLHHHPHWALHVSNLTKSHLKIALLLIYGRETVTLIIEIKNKLLITKNTIKYYIFKQYIIIVVNFVINVP